MMAGVEPYCKHRADAFAVYEVLSYRRACFLAFLLLVSSLREGKGVLLKLIRLAAIFCYVCVLPEIS